MKKPNAKDVLIIFVLGTGMAIFSTEVVNPRAAIGGLWIFIAALAVQVQMLQRELKRLQEPPPTDQGK